MLLNHSYGVMACATIEQSATKPVVGVGGFSKVVATFNHVGGSFNLFLATTGDVWIIPSFRICIMGCMLSMFHVSSRIVDNISESSLLLSQFSAANLALAGFPLTNALGENLPSRH